MTYGAGSKKPDGKAARVDRVAFTRPAAERIAKVVRAVEAGKRDVYAARPAPRLQAFSSNSSGDTKIIRVCTFTGSWSINESKTLTLQGVTTTPNFIAATNQLFTIGDACETQVAYVGKIGTAWHLLNVQHHETAIITSVSVGATAMTFARKLAWIPYPGEGVPISLVGATATSC